MSKRKFIIDCDTGVDDAFAIMLALSREDIDVVAITCVNGNTGLDQVAVNVMKVLEVCQRTDIPVYKGAAKPIIAFHDQVDASHFHGKDGLGDADGIPDPDMSQLRPQHAVDALVKLTRENPGQITLAALAPLTNIALACHMDPNFSKNLKDIIIMGGNFKAKGNHRRVCAEFNFCSDCEAAFVCLNELKCPVSIVTWETCLDHQFTWSDYDKFVGQLSTKAIFFGKISKSCADFYKAKRKGFGNNYTCCDLLAMAVAVCPEGIEKETLVHATVELSGCHTRGQMVVDWREHLKRQPNIKLVQNYNMELFKTLAMDALK